MKNFSTIYKLKLFCNSRFPDCFQTDLKIAGIILGISSILPWIICHFLVIQTLVVNFKRHVGSLSLMVSLIITVSDTCSMLGCFLSVQLGTQILFSVCLVMLDLVMSLIIVISLCKASGSKGRVLFSRPSGSLYFYMLSATLPFSMFGLYYLSIQSNHRPSRSFVSRVILSVDNSDNYNIDTSSRLYYGYFLGAVSAILKFLILIPKTLHLNDAVRYPCRLKVHQIIAVLGNFLQVASIIMQSSNDNKNIFHTMPWWLSRLFYSLYELMIMYFSTRMKLPHRELERMDNIELQNLLQNEELPKSEKQEDSNFQNGTTRHSYSSRREPEVDSSLTSSLSDSSSQNSKEDELPKDAITKEEMKPTFSKALLQCDITEKEVTQLLKTEELTQQYKVQRLKSLLATTSNETVIWFSEVSDEEQFIQ